MKTLFITTIAFLALALTCNAQWTTSGSSIIPLTANLGFNVGIGTATPASTSLLQVQNNTNGPALSAVVNNSTGVNAKASMIVGSVPGTGGTGGTFGAFEYLGAGQVLTGLLGPDRTMLRGSGAGGLFLTAENTGGAISFSTGGTSIANQRMLINSAGKVGIGTATPTEVLTVLGNSVVGSKGTLANFASTYGITNYLGVMGSQTTDISGILLGAVDGSINKRAAMYFDIPNNTIKFSNTYTTGTPANWSFTNGNVGIGTASPDQALTVNGTVHSTTVLVDTNVPPPDYVFKSDYKLPTLSDIKAYTDKNHHLPGIPAAAEMEKNGINVGDMNMALLKKVEELTLYLIEQNKQITEQKTRLADQQNTNELQQRQINELKKSLAKLSHKR